MCYVDRMVRKLCEIRGLGLVPQITRVGVACKLFFWSCGPFVLANATVW
jgi:hypothetical protein